MNISRWRVVQVVNVIFLALQYKSEPESAHSMFTHINKMMCATLGEIFFDLFYFSAFQWFEIMNSEQKKKITFFFVQSGLENNYSLPLIMNGIYTFTTKEISTALTISSMFFSSSGILALFLSMADL